MIKLSSKVLAVNTEHSRTRQWICLECGIIVTFLTLEALFNFYDKAHNDSSDGIIDVNVLRGWTSERNLWARNHPLLSLGLSLNTWWCSSDQGVGTRRSTTHFGDSLDSIHQGSIVFLCSLPWIMPWKRLCLMQGLLALTIPILLSHRIKMAYPLCYNTIKWLSGSSQSINQGAS